MAPKFEDEYLDILQNIESTIVGVFRENPELTDIQVDQALEALLRTYHREAIHGAPVLPKGEAARKVYEAVKMACDWRLGREMVVDEEQQPLTIEPVTIAEMEACLKHIRKSLHMWNKDFGSQGYLNYVKNFLP
jgi:hypothetical protein